MLNRLRMISFCKVSNVNSIKKSTAYKKSHQSKMTKVKLLIANDDGISAPGLHCLLKALYKLNNKYDIRVGSTESERSGSAHAFSFHMTTRQNHKNLNIFKFNLDVPKMAHTLIYQ